MNEAIQPAQVLPKKRQVCFSIFHRRQDQHRRLILRKLFGAAARRERETGANFSYPAIAAGLCFRWPAALPSKIQTQARFNLPQLVLVHRSFELSTGLLPGLFPVAGFEGVGAVENISIQLRHIQQRGTPEHAASGASPGCLRLCAAVDTPEACCARIGRSSHMRRLEYARRWLSCHHIWWRSSIQASSCNAWITAICTSRRSGWERSSSSHCARYGPSGVLDRQVAQLAVATVVHLADGDSGCAPLKLRQPICQRRVRIIIEVEQLQIGIRLAEEAGYRALRQRQPAVGDHKA